MDGEEQLGEEKRPEELDDGEEGSSSEDEEEEDDEAELLAELEKIKKERAAERERKLEEEEKARHEKIIQGNPLLHPPQPGKSVAKFTSEAQFEVKRRWDDDVIFKNCTRGMDDRSKKPRFINDSLRSDFHRRFMDKYFQ